MFASGMTANIVPLAMTSSVPDSVTEWVRERRLVALHQSGFTGAGVKVLVIDTGVDKTHPYLASNIGACRNFTPDDGGDPNNVTDRQGHGSHVAGIVHTGAPGATILMAKGLSDQGYGDDAWLAAAIRWGIAEGVQIINASWGDPNEPTNDVMHSAIREAVAAGILFVASAGNSGHAQLDMNTVGWPARWQEPLAVAATWTLVADALHPNYNATYSSAGPEVDVAAPGTYATSCAPGGGYVVMSGTSMAAPMVAAEMACLYEMWFHMTGAFPAEPQGVTLALFHTRDIQPAGRDNLAGVGEIDGCPVAKRRRVTVTKGSNSIKVEEADGNGAPTTTYVALDVPAQDINNRFMVPFRGLFNAAGAAEVSWSQSAPNDGVGVIEVLYMGPTVNKG